MAALLITGDVLFGAEQVLGIDANAVRVGGLMVVTVMTLDDLAKVELWIEEEVLGLGLDETKSN